MTSQPTVDARETHLSTLFFTPERVFKLLKPVSLPFVDFADTARRCAAATHEFERNRAISPDVYLGLTDIHEGDELVDRMIIMRRLPAERELGRMLARGAVDDLLTSVARRVARMHAALPALSGADAEPASVDAIAQNWENNFAAIQPVVGSVIEPDEFHRVTSLARTFLAGRAPLFQRRIDEGWVRDGHGDLRAEHIYCVDGGPELIDCVAFDDRLRISDSLADVAFLAMDLDRLAGPGAAVAFMRSWNEFTNESHPSSLAHFYVGYRAHVRCKIECLNHLDGDTDAAAKARTYHELAHRHLDHARVRLVLVGGGPGTGKSTVAERVAAELGAAWIRSDEVRKDVAGVPHGAHAFADPDEGLYAPAVTAKTFEELTRQTKALLGQGLSVVLDATWRSAADRAALRQVAEQAAARVTELRCVLPRALAKERIIRRMASVYNPSDATPELVDYMAERFDEWPEATPIDTSQSVAISVDAAVRALSPQIPIHRLAAMTPVRFTIDLASLRNQVLITGGLGDE